MYMYMYMNTYIYLYMNIYIYLYIYTFTYMYIHIYLLDSSQTLYGVVKASEDALLARDIPHARSSISSIFYSSSSYSSIREAEPAACPRYPHPRRARIQSSYTF